jgi:hypothetical protein
VRSTLRAYEAHVETVRERQKMFLRSMSQPLAAALQTHLDLQPFTTGSDEQAMRRLSTPAHVTSVDSLPFNKVPLQNLLREHSDAYSAAVTLLVNERDDRYFMDRHVLSNMTVNEIDTITALRRAAHTLLTLRIEIALHRVYFGDSRHADLVSKKNDAERAAALLARNIADDPTLWLAMGAVRLDDEYERDVQPNGTSVHAFRQRLYGVCCLPNCTPTDIHCAINCKEVMNVMGAPPIYCNWTAADIHARVAMYTSRFLVAAAHRSCDTTGVRRLVDPGPAPPPYRPPPVRALGNRGAHKHDRDRTAY